MRLLNESGLVVAGCAAVALLVNGVRADGIPLVRTEPFELYVPCPELQGDAEALAPGDPRFAGALVLDARPAHDHDAWSWPGAVHVPFDWLEPTARATLANIAGSGAARVVVYGDGGDPDTGEQLARELAGKGIRNVFYVRGGAPALRAAPPEPRRRRRRRPASAGAKARLLRAPGSPARPVHGEAP